MKWAFCQACGLIRLRNAATAAAERLPCSGERPAVAVVSQEYDWSKFS
jgi:hypothetical protein